MNLYESINNLKEDETLSDEEYNKVKETLSKKAKMIEQILQPHATKDVRCDVWNTLIEDGDYSLELRDVYFAPEGLSKYTNEPHIYGSIYLDKDFNFTKVDIMTSSGPNVLNQDYISALNALYTFIKSNGNHWED